MLRTALLQSTTSCLLLVAAWPAVAQDARERARRAVVEAEAHADHGRHALAAQRYLEAYDFMREAGMPRAPLVLWNAGELLSHVPGREQDAVDLIRRFLSESSTLADEAAQVRDTRSSAMSLLDELEARAGPPPPASPTAETPAAHLSTPGAPPPATAAGGPAWTPPFALLGVGLALGAAAAGLGIAVTLRDDELSAMCTDGRCPSSAQALADEVGHLALGADLVLAAGGLVTAAAVVWAIVAASQPPSEARPTVSAGCGVSGCTIDLRGRF
ncbi:MAG: hypothetical protein KF729_36480 [Sandaracinaceae bacterium]|nr:hypothetical protein [Sandaracinaceae bacterium]